MRNWNTTMCRSTLCACGGFQPTYEELKPLYPATSTIASLVFSLPMRNWNTSKWGNSARSTIVFSLPMRNWNASIQFAKLWSVKVFSLPMRNWNEVQAFLGCKPSHRFQPTYEVRISVHPDSETGGIRTANRKYPDTLSAKLINIKCDSSNRC